MYIKYMMGVFLLQWDYSFVEKTAWVDHAHDTEQLPLFYMIVTNIEKQASCASGGRWLVGGLGCGPPYILARLRCNNDFTEMMTSPSAKGM